MQPVMGDRTWYLSDPNTKPAPTMTPNEKVPKRPMFPLL